jgi:hypothetical protein
MGNATQSRRRNLRPIERALMLIALGLDPDLIYDDRELHGAWWRKIALVHPDTGRNGVAAAAINVAYMSLAQRVEVYKPVDMML